MPPLPLPPLYALKPFRSFLFLKLPPGDASETRVLTLRNAVADLVRTLAGAGVVTPSPRSKKSEIYSAFAVYSRKGRPSWTADSRLIDIEHHLLVASCYRYWFAVYVSDDGLRHALRTALAEEAEAFAGFEQIPPNKLNAIFVKGRARTLWLNNVQRRSSLKADHKILSGLSLEDSLDPLGDQAYTFTAARCQNDVVGTRASYGVAPRKSRFWFRPSKSWDEYVATVDLLLHLLDESTEEENAPLPILSAPVDQLPAAAALGEAYEMSLLPVELLNPADEEDFGEFQAESIPEFDFEVVGSVPGAIQADVRAHNGDPLGRYLFRFDLISGRIRWEVSPISGEVQGIVHALRAFSSRLNVSFDGGYAFSDGAVHALRLRDFPFSGFVWQTFAGVAIKKEKPTPLSAATIGTQDSLFCFVKNGWSTGSLGWLPQGGFLACNDGSLEVADFIHLQDNGTPTLTLIHVKAAKNAAPNRPLATVPYEVVVSQALKNLRHSDPQIASDEFVARVGKQVQNAVWRDGQPVQRSEMLSALGHCGTNIARRVVILQPHTRKQARAEALTAPEGSRQRHLVRQLHFLLLSAQTNCTGVGASLEVIGHDA